MSAEHHPVISDEITYQPEHASGTKKIWKTFWILTVITILELALGYWMYTIHNTGVRSGGLLTFIKGAIIIFTLAKAYYIVSIFMHLGDEIRNFTMTILLPLTLFSWFILAFILDGKSWLNYRNTDAGTRVYHPTEQVHQAEPAVHPQTKP